MFFKDGADLHNLNEYRVTSRRNYLSDYIPSISRKLSLILAILGHSSCYRHVVAQPHFVKWEIEATVISITDPHKVFPDTRLGDTVRGSLSYNLNSYFYDIGNDSGFYPHAPTFPLTEMVIENPRTGIDLEFVREPRYDPEVYVLNDEEFSDNNTIFTTQPVRVPDGADPTWTPIVSVYLEGPSDALASRHLPPQLDLDDWPIALIGFSNKIATAISDTIIDAEIYSLTPIAVSMVPGDFDADGDVDPDDYAIWRSTFGSTEWRDADASGNGQVDAADYVVWRNNASRVSLSNPGATVPESTSATLLLPLAIVIAAAGSRARRP
jgi:hypothetical protein